MGGGRVSRRFVHRRPFFPVVNPGGIVGAMAGTTSYTRHSAVGKEGFWRAISGGGGLWGPFLHLNGKPGCERFLAWAGPLYRSFLNTVLLGPGELWHQNLTELFFCFFFKNERGSGGPGGAG